MGFTTRHHGSEIGKIMENLVFEFEGGKVAPKAPYALVGVVASSNLEVMVESFDGGGKVRFEIATTAAHYSDLWKAVCADFVHRNSPCNARFSINDFAATPNVVSLRLDQAWESAL